MASRTSRKKKYSKSELPTQWSEYAWDEQKSCWSRFRLDAKGEYEFQDAPPEEPASATDIPEPARSETPRYAPVLDAPPEDSNLSVAGTSPDYTFEDVSSRFDSMILDKGKGREEVYGDSSERFPSVASQHATGTGGETFTEDTDWEESRKNSLGTVTFHGKSPDLPTQPNYEATQPPVWQATQATSSALPHSTQQHNQNLFISSDSTGAEDRLNKGFKVHHASEFKFGKVFKILWAEPTGVNGTQITEPIVSKSHAMSEGFVHKIRRFVVIRKFHGHCLCLPIHTYQRKATTKPGLQAQDHAIIYTEKPVSYHGENLEKKAIRVIPSNPREKLDPQSRLNYAKIYTIEFNVKVLFVGRVDKLHHEQMLATYLETHGMSSQAPSSDSRDTYQDTRYAGGS